MYILYIFFFKFFLHPLSHLSSSLLKNIPTVQHGGLTHPVSFLLSKYTNHTYTWNRHNAPIFLDIKRTDVFLHTIVNDNEVPL